MIIQAPYVPGPGATVVGNSFGMEIGGRGINQSVAAARAGAADVRPRSPAGLVQAAPGPLFSPSP